MTTGIYKIENLINGKIYIGQSIHIEKRWIEHCKQSSHSLIGEAIKKYGKENFSFQIIEECSVDQLDEMEEKYIINYNSLVPNGYNIVLTSPSQTEVYRKYTKSILLEIVEDLKNSSLTFQEIADKYDLDLSMIYYLNRGDFHSLPEENYPLRPVKDLSKKDYFCVDCGCRVAKGSTRCEKCSQIAQRKCERPSREDLKQLIRTMPFTKIATRFGVSDNAIRKWCDSYGLPRKASEIKAMSDDEWEKI